MPPITLHDPTANDAAAGFEILHAEEISQNTFPSAVFVAVKTD